MAEAATVNQVHERGGEMHVAKLEEMKGQEKSARSSQCPYLLLAYFARQSMQSGTVGHAIWCDSLYLRRRLAAQTASMITPPNFHNQGRVMTGQIAP